jgi:pyruvate-formate lyase-activating enzyme
VSKESPCLLIADHKGRIMSVPELGAVGMRAGVLSRLMPSDLIALPSGSELFLLPDRKPIGFDPSTRAFVHLEHNPLASSRHRECYPVAAFISPGYTVTHISAYTEGEDPRQLPLFAYAAVAEYKKKFFVAAVRVDRERRQDIRYMDMALIKRNVEHFRKLFPKNRLMRHLESCALCYGCPAAKNFFQQRYEAPLPTSPTCNARCLGCLSLQPEGKCSLTQPRITFVPTPQEIAETALWHIKNVPDPLVSFGQGCEGEPLMVSDTIKAAIGLIRRKTKKGIINLNSNASRPRAVEKLFSAGLDSIRVSMNSVQKYFYTRYYRPQGYSFEDVCRSIQIAKKKQGWVSINYLSMPGLTDSREEIRALKRFIRAYKVDMIQWRNLNFDPGEYFRLLNNRHSILGSNTHMRDHIENVHTMYPHLLQGYFNPSRRRMGRKT